MIKGTTNTTATFVRAKSVDGCISRPCHIASCGEGLLSSYERRLMMMLMMMKVLKLHGISFT